MQVILPIAISFFVFQAISYVVDTYRETVVPGSLLDFAVYLSFFPHLGSGRSCGPTSSSRSCTRVPTPATSTRRARSG